MLRLITSLDEIGEYVRLSRVNLQRYEKLCVTKKCLSEYEPFRIKSKILNREFNFGFNGYIINRVGGIGGFGCQIPIRLPHKNLPIKSLGLDVASPQIVENDINLKNGDIFFEDHAFFAIDEQAQKIKLFHTCNFKPHFFDLSELGNIDFKKINRRFIQKHSPIFSTALSNGGIIRSGIEIYDLSSGEFSNNLILLIDHLKHENIQILKKYRKNKPEDFWNKTVS